MSGEALWELHSIILHRLRIIACCFSMDVKVLDAYHRSCTWWYICCLVTVDFSLCFTALSIFFFLCRGTKKPIGLITTFSIIIHSNACPFIVTLMIHNPLWICQPQSTIKINWGAVIFSRAFWNMSKLKKKLLLLQTILLCRIDIKLYFNIENHIVDHMEHF